MFALNSKFMFIVIEICSWLLLIIALDVGHVFPPCLRQALSQITLIFLQTASGITYGVRKNCFFLLNHSTIFIILLQRSTCT